jgi:ArsR family transcriptional regulator
MPLSEYADLGIYHSMIDPVGFFAALADPFRLRCLALISARGEVCVCQLTHALDAPQPRVSKHLGVLRDAGALVQRRAGQWMLYRIASLPDWATQVIAGALASIADEPRHHADLRRIATAPDGPPPTISVRYLRHEANA